MNPNEEIESSDVDMDADMSAKPASNLNAGQEVALNEIINSFMNKRPKHRLIGPAGVGKTYLMQEVVRRLRELPRYRDSKIENNSKGRDVPRVRVGVTAPTHKAVEVLRNKLDEAGLFGVETMTIHAMCGLKPGVADSEKMVLKRSGGKGCTGDFEVVIIDECSMIGQDLQNFIDNDLRFHFVIYVGDKAQLPPVGEVDAPCMSFGDGDGCGVSELTEIVRQEAGNPIIAAATILRLQQGSGRMNWDWCKPVSSEDGSKGIYLARDDADFWMKDAFTSEQFVQDNDSFRYIAYTNERVKEVNNKVRQWIYGDTPTPFVIGERVICRNPIIGENERPAFATNQEATVASIEAGIHRFDFYACAAGPGKIAMDRWQYDLPVWKVGLEHPDMGIVIANMARNENEVKSLDRRLITEAKANRERWFSRFQMLETIADLRAVYAMTTHSSQGSTFGNVFCDVPDMSKLERRNVLELQKLFYVAVTRAKYAVVLIGVR